GRRLTGDPERGSRRLVHGHALGQDLVPAEQVVHEFAGIAVLLEAGGVVARLVIEQHELGAFADLLEVAEIAALRRDVSAVHSDPEAVGTAGSLGGAVVQFPDFDAAGVVPVDPLAVGGIVPVFALRKCGARFLPELAGAVVAIADSLTRES